jgi:uncharacterized protein
MIPIDPKMHARVLAKLTQIEQTQHVRILLAVESGSRAWGFPSRDSDYDVRFVYAGRLESYLTVSASRDVIEQPVDDLLDLGGWDLRKALQLALRTNAALLEWLSSPVSYRPAGAEAAQMRSFARAAASMPSLFHHYHHLAQRSWDSISGAGDTVRMKTYCYGLRPALALLWLEQQSTLPPMDVPRLSEGLDLAPAARDAIAALISTKAEATEADTIARMPALDTLIGAALRVTPPIAKHAPPRNLHADADAVFRSVVLGGSNGAPARA